MTNTKELMAQYGVAWFGFDEDSGNVVDKLGKGYVGTVTGNTRVTGWNGDGNALNFDGNDYTIMNNKVIPTGAYSIRFKFKNDVIPTTENQEVFGNAYSQTNDYGLRCWINTAGDMTFALCRKQASVWGFAISIKGTTDYQWHDVLFTWDGTTGTDGIKIYLDDMKTPITVGKSTVSNTTAPTYNLHLGRVPTLNERYLKGKLDDFQVYNKVLSLSDFTQERIYVKSETGKNLVLLDDRLKEVPSEDETIILEHAKEIKEIDYAVDRNTSYDLTKTLTKYETIGADGISTITEGIFIPKEILGEQFDVKYYTDTSDVSQVYVETETDPYSVYEYISDTPQVVVYTETTEDVAVTTQVEPFTLEEEFANKTVKVIEYTDNLAQDESVVSVETEAFDLYDEFGESVDVLFYTDDTTSTEADLVLEANWSPIDELDGDIEVVTWTDEDSTTAQRALEMTAIPKPQIVKLVNPKRLYGYLEDIITNDISKTYKDKEEARYFFADENTASWYVYENGEFVLVDTSTHEFIKQNGMTFDEVNALVYEDWSKWGKDWINIGVFLKDNPRDTIVSVVDNMTYKDFLPRNSTKVSDASLYILNTTARIDLTMTGNSISGVLSDDDLTRVQYRVLINGENYYPSDGSFTNLSSPPQNISITIPSSRIVVDEINTVKVEFKDFFGTTDYWQADFIGTYSGLVFKDIYGDYYSNDIGEVLKYLDFGIIIAGQTTVEHEIILRNSYGYDVKNIQVLARSENFPQGMSLQFAKGLAPFEPENRLLFEDGLLNGEELSFYVRLKTELGSTPNANGSFDIIVKAEKA